MKFEMPESISERIPRIKTASSDVPTRWAMESLKSADVIKTNVKGIVIQALITISLDVS
jgi:hypothetical protein